MLTFLQIENILLIESVKINLTGTLCVLTGETGAGKSIILNSILFLLGKKIKTDKKSLTRVGCETGFVLGIFDISNLANLKTFLSEKSINSGDEIIIKRVINSAGKDRCLLNDQIISSTLLEEIGSFLMEVNRQNEQISLLDTKQHIKILDEYAKCAHQVSELSKIHSTLLETRRNLAQAKSEFEKEQADIEYLEHLISEIDDLNIKENEETDLVARKSKISALENDFAALKSIEEKLFGKYDIRHSLVSVSRTIPSNADESLQGMEQSIERILNELNSIEVTIKHKFLQNEYNPHEIEDVNERLFLIRDISRKYKVQSFELPQLLEETKTRLANISINEGNIKKFEQLERKITQEYLSLAQTISDIRKSATGNLEFYILRELNSLKMDGAVFKVNITKSETYKSDGFDIVEFTAKTNPGMPFGYLNKIASGGELSRFMLAIKSALIDTTQVPSIIFDEIDSGIGGETSEAVAQKLLKLSNKIQVILVTHQAQIAVKADLHLKINKNVNMDDDHSITNVYPISEAERENEIARMLSGSYDAESILAARRMLKQSSRV